MTTAGGPPPGLIEVDLDAYAHHLEASGLLEGGDQYREPPDMSPAADHARGDDGRGWER